MLQMNVTVKNVSAAAVLPTLYIVTVSQGLFSIFNGQCSALIGVLTSNDILESHAQTAHAMVSYEDVRHISGGNFLSGWKTKLMDVWQKIKPYVKGVAKVAQFAAPLLLGLGDGGDDGGIRHGYDGNQGGTVRAHGSVSAGARMHKRSLAHRLK